jgi:sortase A
MRSRSFPPRSVDLRVVERVLFVVGVLLLAWYGLQRLTIEYDQRASSRELEEIRMSVAPPANATANAPARPARGALLGRIELDRVGVSAIVREGDDTGVLRRAVGHIPETVLPGEPGNAGLAGHRDTFFRGLRDVRPGDRIVVTTPRSVVTYEVQSTRIVEPTDVSVLQPTSGPTLTLVTCYPFNYIGAAPKRFIVRAQLAGMDDNSRRDASRIHTIDN